MPTLALALVAILALAPGPLLLGLGGRGRREGIVAALDGFVLVSISGLVLLHVLPEAVGLGGWWAAGGALAGALLARLAHGLGHDFERPASPAMLALAGLGLAAHATLDGMALGAEAGGADRALAAAVVLHRLPMGMAIWWFVRPALGRAAALGMVGAVAAGTLAGAAAGDALLRHLASPVVGGFQGLVAGSVVHVILHHHGDRPRAPRASAAGAVAGGLLLVVLDLLHAAAPEPDRLLPLLPLAGTAALAAGVGWMLQGALERGPASGRVDLAALLTAALVGGPVAGLAVGGALLLRGLVAPPAACPAHLPGRLAARLPGLLVGVLLAPAAARLLAPDAPTPDHLLLPAIALAAWLVPLGGPGWAVVTAFAFPGRGAVLAVAVAAGARGPGERGTPRSAITLPAALAAGLATRHLGPTPPGPVLPATLAALPVAAALVGGLALLFRRGARGFLAPIVGEEPHPGAHHHHAHPPAAPPPTGRDGLRAGRGTGRTARRGR